MADAGQQETQGYTPREAINRLLRAAAALVTLVVVGTFGYMRIEVVELLGLFVHGVHHDEYDRLH
jgi:hypothetical protein